MFSLSALSAWHLVWAQVQAVPLPEHSVVRDLGIEWEEIENELSQNEHTASIFKRRC